MPPTSALIATLVTGLIAGPHPLLGSAADLAHHLVRGSDHPVGLRLLFAADMAGTELAASSLAGSLLARLLPLVYGACFLALLWQAFRVMSRGYGAVPRPGDQPRMPVGDRTGRVTIHPELLDADGQLTRDDLLTVRFTGDNEQPATPDEPG